MRPTPAVPTSKNTTCVVLNGSTSWRAAICVVTVSVIASAGAATERLAPTTAQDVRPIYQGGHRDNSFTGITRPESVTTLALPSRAVVQQLLVSVGDHVQSG